MGFLDTIQSPTGNNISNPSGGSFLDTVISPTLNQENTANLKINAYKDLQESNKENSFGSIVKNTFSDLGNRLVNVPINFAKSLWDTYSTTPSKLGEDIKSGSTDMSNGINNPDLGVGTSDIIKGMAKTGLRTAGDAGLAIFAPISSAIGAALTATGGQELIDSAGKIIADNNGITDIPAFQKFAMDHPNAGEDFNRILTLFMSAGEKGTIDPERIVNETKGFADKIISGAKDNGEVTSKNSPPTSLPPNNFIDSVIKPENNGQTINLQNKELYHGSDQKFNQFDINQAKTGSYGPAIHFADTKEAALANGENLTPSKISGKFFDVGNSSQEAQILKENGGDEASLRSSLENQGYDGIKKGTEYIVFKDEVANQGLENNNLPLRENGVTKTASDINQNLVKQGFDALPVEEQQKYTPQSYQDIATKVASMMDNNIEEVKSMATGDTPIPKDINPEILHNAIEAYAMKDLTPENVQLLKDMADHGVSKTSEAAQILGGHGFNDNPNSPVKLIQDVSKAREENISKNGIKGNTVKDIQSEINKASPTKETWESFIENIKCNY